MSAFERTLKQHLVSYRIVIRPGGCQSRSAAGVLAASVRVGHVARRVRDTWSGGLGRATWPGTRRRQSVVPHQQRRRRVSPSDREVRERRLADVTCSRFAAAVRRRRQIRSTPPRHQAPRFLVAEFTDTLISC